MTGIANRIAVCGAGAMGAGIAQVAAQSGAAVIIYDTSTDALQSGRERVVGGLAALVERGKLSAEDVAGIGARIRWTDDIAALCDAELVIEAIIEHADIKGELFARLEAIVAPDAILASNTSSLPISRLAKTLERPDRFVGMHFFNPAPAMKLVEVIAGTATDANVAERVSATARSWGKVAVDVADVPGFIVNRVARPFYAEAFQALAERAAPAQVIDALFREGAGFRMGPLELTDLIGQDVNFAVARSVFEGYFGRTRFFPQLAQGALVDAGHLGCKTGRGVYRYGADEDVRLLPPSLSAPVISSGAPRFDLIPVGGILIGLSSGRTAAREAKEAGKPVALFDWGAADSTVMGFAASSQAAADVATGIATARGARAFRIDDRPGLIVLRTLAQIANAAADAALEHVSDEAGIDAAMRFGANYPFGPFGWADDIRRSTVASILTEIAAATGERIYAPSQYWRIDRV